MILHILQYKTADIMKFDIIMNTDDKVQIMLNSCVLFSATLEWEGTTADGLEQQEISDPYGWQQVSPVFEIISKKLLCHPDVDSSAGSEAMYSV